MWTVINGFDRTSVIPFDTIQLQGTINDPMSSFSFDLYDEGSQIDLGIGMEVILFDESRSSLFGQVTPAHNFLRGSSSFTSSFWTRGGNLSSIITTDENSFTMIFNNSAVGSGYFQQSSLLGYVKAGQRYMLSMFINTAAVLTNAQVFLLMNFRDQNGNILLTSNTSTSINTNNTFKQIATSAIAPANTTSIQIQVGGQAISTSNSGTFTAGLVQLEPMWFESVSYPTLWNGFESSASHVMPDGTASSLSRIFAGYIEDIIKTYDGLNRTYQITCASAQKILDNTNLISATYSTSFDDSIITNIIVNYFSQILSYSNPNGFIAPTVIRGLQIDSISFTDQTFREILNSLSNNSGYNVYVDPYYQLHYKPLSYDIASVSFSDMPDDVTSFSYHDYSIEEDGTQIKQRIKVVGANPAGPAQTQTWIGDGIGKNFFLNFIPANINSLQTNGVDVAVGILGINTYAQGYAALVDAPNKVIRWNTPPPNGVTTIVEYTYQNPVVAASLKLDGITSQIIAPDYVTPTFDALINDAGLTSIAACNARGLAEISKYGLPLEIIKFKSSQYVPPGYTVYFSSIPDQIVDQPFIVQTVNGTCLGNGINEYAFQLGSYLPTIIDTARNTINAMNRSSSIGNVTVPQQTSLVLSEIIAWSSEQITHIP